MIESLKRYPLCRPEKFRRLSWPEAMALAGVSPNHRFGHSRIIIERPLEPNAKASEAVAVARPAETAFKMRRNFAGEAWKPCLKPVQHAQARLVLALPKQACKAFGPDIAKTTAKPAGK